LVFIQDLLNGDDRFVPNRPGALKGPATPPKPTVRGPGEPIRRGFVTCAMTQLRDDVSTRTLHMLASTDGRTIQHATASDFGPVQGGAFSRFRMVSPWADVLAVVGGPTRRSATSPS
jgi:hypothetical protein